MASRVAIALRRREACTRLQAAMDQIGLRFDVDAPQLAADDGQPTALDQVRELEAVAVFLEGLGMGKP